MLITLRVVLTRRQVLSILLRSFSCRDNVSRDLTMTIRRIEVVGIYLRLTSMTMRFVCTALIKDENEAFMSTYPLTRSSNTVPLILRRLQGGLVLQIMEFLARGEGILVCSVLRRQRISPMFLITSCINVANVLAHRSNNA